VEELCGRTIDYALLHLYKDGTAHIGWHNDKEALDGEIVSVSFGHPRLFRIKGIDQTSGWLKEYTLGHGDVLIMKRGMQRLYKHSVPKQLKIKSSVDGVEVASPAASAAARCNYTCRNFPEPYDDFNEFGIRVINLRGRQPQKIYEDRGEIYCGRAVSYGGWELKGSKWGNPFRKSDYGGSLFRLLKDYESYIISNRLLVNSLWELEGKTLCCWCVPAYKGPPDTPTKGGENISSPPFVGCHCLVLKKLATHILQGNPLAIINFDDPEFHIELGENLAYAKFDD